MHQIARQFRIFFLSQSDHAARQALFESIWKEYYQKLTVFVRAMMRNSTGVEDIMQDIMLKVFRNLHRYNPLYSFNTWIYSIARYHCVDVLRKHPAVATVALDDISALQVPDDIAGPDEITEYDETQTIIAACMNRMNGTDRQIAFLRFYERLPYRNIGNIMGIPTGTVKSRIHEIRQQLKHMLEDQNA